MVGGHEQFDDGTAEIGICCQTDLTMTDLEAQEADIRTGKDQIQTQMQNIVKLSAEHARQTEEKRNEIIVAVAEAKYHSILQIRELETKLI